MGLRPAAPWAALFDVFTVPFLKGSAATAFKEPNSVLITESTAKRYFGSEDPMHKVLRTDRGDAQVTGVIRDIPEQAHIHYDFLLPMQRDIRKIVGASVTGIVVLLSKDFIRLVALSILIATPLAWFAMDQWLGNFAYRITIQWWIFLVAGAIAVIIALATVSLQTIKAALTNPVKALRSE